MWYDAGTEEKYCGWKMKDRTIKAAILLSLNFERAPLIVVKTNRVGHINPPAETLEL